MRDLFLNIPDEYTKVSPGFVDTLIQSRRAELFTGLMRMHYPAGELLVFTFLDGSQQKLYRGLEKSMQAIPRTSWQAAMDLPDACVSFIPLTIESMRLMQVVHDAPIRKAEAQSMAAQQLAHQVQEWSGASEPSILHLHSSVFDRIYLVLGRSNRVIESVSFANGASNFSVNDTTFPTLLPEGDLHVTRYVSDSKHASWQEYELRLAFNPFVRLLLNRFGELAGRMLTERLCERISNGLREEGLNIKVTPNGVSNRQYLESLEKTVDVYVGILRSFHDEASPAIGQRMAEGLSHEILRKLEPYHRETVVRHIFDDNRVDKVTGRVWRQSA